MSGRRFPIAWPEQVHGRAVRTISWDILAAHEPQARRNHGQTLERLAERGGLSACEAVAILEDRDWRSMSEEAASVRLAELADLAPQTNKTGDTK